MKEQLLSYIKAKGESAKIDTDRELAEGRGTSSVFWIRQGEMKSLKNIENWLNNK